MKSNLVKKIVSISIIAIILAIVTTTVVLALVQKSLYNPINYTYYDVDLDKEICLEDKFKQLQISRDAVPNSYLKDGSDKDNEVIAKISELQKDSTKASILSHMLQGSELDTKPVAKDEGNVHKKFVEEGKGVVCLVYYFSEDVKLYYDGEVYKNEKANDPDAPVTFNRIYFVINNTSEFSPCTAYFANNEKSHYQITFLAHQSEIYQYIISLKWNFFMDAQ